MPIVFEQPSPMSPTTSINAGRAETATKDFPSIAGLYESANRNQLGASEAAAHLALQASSTQAGLSERQGELAVHQQQAEADRQQRMQMLAGEVNAQQQATRQRAETQAWLQGQELSQAESMHLQRQQNALGYLQAEHDAHRLDDDTYYGLATQLRTGIDPMRQRQEATRAKMMQQQQEAVAHQNAAAETMQQQDMAFAAGNLDKLPLVTDPNTGKQHRMLRDHHGKWYDPFEGSGAGSSQKVQEHELDQQRQDEKHFNDAYTATQKDADAWATPRVVGKDAQGNPQYKSRAEQELGHPPTTEEQQRYFSGVLAERTGGSSSLSDHVQKRAESRRLLRHPPEKIGMPTPVGAPPAPAAPPAAPSAQQFPKEKRELLDDVSKRIAAEEEKIRQQQRIAQGNPSWIDRHVGDPLEESLHGPANWWRRQTGREER